MRSADTGTLETGGFEVGADVQSEISSRSGRGVPLADDQRSKFEQFFGKDLSDVRVHADNDASQLSGSLGAEAFTVGNDVYFGSGRYQSGASDKLLAHELTHVVQQNSTLNRRSWLDKLLGRNKEPAPAPAPAAEPHYANPHKGDPWADGWVERENRANFNQGGQSPGLGIHGAAANEEESDDLSDLDLSSFAGGSGSAPVPEEPIYADPAKIRDKKRWDAISPGENYKKEGYTLPAPKASKPSSPSAQANPGGSEYSEANEVSDYDEANHPEENQSPRRALMPYPESLYQNLHADGTRKNHW
jgi:hypothetical protein